MVRENLHNPFNSVIWGLRQGTQNFVKYANSRVDLNIAIQREKFAEEEIKAIYSLTLL